MICNNFRSVRETGLEELGKRPYRTLPSLFVKNSFLYETSLYIPSRSDAYHLNLFSRRLGHRLGHNPRIRLLRYAVSMFPPFVKLRLKGEQNYTKRLVNQITYISQFPDSSLHFCMIFESVKLSANAETERFSCLTLSSMHALITVSRSEEKNPSGSGKLPLPEYRVLPR